jgi:hypothetical protein
MLQWMWMYFGMAGGPRLITGSQKLPGWGTLSGEPTTNGQRLDANSPGAVESRAAVGK